jgi:hypothetical protein
MTKKPCVYAFFSLIDEASEYFQRARERGEMIQLRKMRAEELAGYVAYLCSAPLAGCCSAVDTGTIETFLKRHLSDEEELAVPIILHHHLRG